jgi:predicted phage tail protein
VHCWLCRRRTEMLGQAAVVTTAIRSSTKTSTSSSSVPRAMAVPAAGSASAGAGAAVAAVTVARGVLLADGPASVPGGLMPLLSPVHDCAGAYCFHLSM